MSVVQGDYLMRMIEQSAAAIAEIAALILAGEFDLALIVVRRTSEREWRCWQPKLELASGQGATNPQLRN